MTGLHRFIIRFIILLGCFNCEVEAKGLLINVWDLTGQSDLVVAVEVKSVDTNITVAVSQLLKGQLDDAILTFPAPLLPSQDLKGIICPPPRSWTFIAGEKWVLFFKKVEGQYCFTDGRTHQFAETLVAIHQFLEVQSSTSDMEKVQQLVQIAMDHPGISTMPALNMLSSLNKPEFLDLLTPLEEQTTYRRAYISLLRDNSNPKATDVLCKMLYTESGNNLRDVMFALRGKDLHNEELTKEILPFLEHTNSVIRSTSVFVLKYRDYRKGFPAIVKALDDPDPKVRASALAWPWYAYVNDHPEVKGKIKRMRKDKDEQVRDAAKRALSGISVWYRFWYNHN